MLFCPYFRYITVTRSPFFIIIVTLLDLLDLAYNDQNLVFELTRQGGRREEAGRERGRRGPRLSLMRG